MSDKWIEWARRIQAISQSGLHFSKDVFDIERYEELKQISAEIMADYSKVDLQVVENLFAKENGYQTPKIDVRAVIFKSDKILLVREKIDSLWSLPGGFCDVGFSPSENAVKEVREESGFDVEASKLIALLDMNKHDHPAQPYHYYKVFIECEIISGQPNAGLETSDVHFFSKDALPKLSTGRNTEAQIHALFESKRNPVKKAIVD